MSQPSRKPVNLSLHGALVSQARDLNINLSRAAEEGIERAVKSERERLWRIENAEAIEASNKYVEKHGLGEISPILTTGFQVDAIFVAT